MARECRHANPFHLAGTNGVNIAAQTENGRFHTVLPKNFRSQIRRIAFAYGPQIQLHHIWHCEDASIQSDSRVVYQGKELLQVLR